MTFRSRSGMPSALDVQRDSSPHCAEERRGERRAWVMRPQCVEVQSDRQRIRPCGRVCLGAPPVPHVQNGGVVIGSWLAFYDDAGMV